MTIIQTLCGYWDNLYQKFGGKSLYQCKYKDNIREYFERYKQHEALGLYNHLANSTPSIGAFLEMVLSHSEPPELNLIADYGDYTDYFNNSNGKFIDFVKKFYTDTNFQSFFESNKSEYEKIRNDFLNSGEIIAGSKYIFEYLGIDDKNYKIILSPLVFGDFGIKIKTLETKTTGYTIISAGGYKDGKYLFGNEEAIKHVIWHEIGHTVINDLTEKYLDQSDIENIEVPDIFRGQFYGRMESVINEYIINSITYLLEKDNGSANLYLEEEGENGFTEIKAIKNYIKENCENNNKLTKGENYKNLIKYVIGKIKAYCA
jgi:hypothetical protein